MTSVELSRRVGKVVAYPPLSEMGDLSAGSSTRRYSTADTFEDLPDKWQAAILKVEENLPELRIVACD